MDAVRGDYMNQATQDTELRREEKFETNLIPTYLVIGVQ